ncbi:MAG: hypothetical protein GTN68_43075 [Candidatus Aminicenantes bacterium]|nr:hypothetical protein [Candidatus Aminicenantes bacterium]
MGELKDTICTFARRSGNKKIITVAPRFFTRIITQPEEFPFNGEVWKDSSLVLSLSKAGASFRNIFTNEIVTVKVHKDATVLSLSEVFANFPVVLLEKLNK